MGGVSIENTSPSGSSPRSTGRRRWVWPVAGALGTLLLAGVLGYRFWISTPQYSLLQARSAFESHDLRTFQKYVALDSCADSLADDVLAQAAKKMNASADSNPLGDVGQKMAQGFMALLKPAISGALQGAARDFVSTGRLASSSGGGGSPVDLSAIERKLQQRGVHFDGIGPASVEGPTATIELRFKNNQAQEPPVELQMRRVEDHWQVTKWKNSARWMDKYLPQMP